MGYRPLCVAFFFTVHLYSSYATRSRSVLSDAIPESYRLPPSDFSGVIAVCPRSQYTIVFSFCQFFLFHSLKKSALSTNCNNAYCANYIKLRKELFSSLRSPRCSAEPIVFRRLIFLPISTLAAGRRSQHKAWTQIVCKKCSAEVRGFEPGSGIIRPRYKVGVSAAQEGG